MFTTAPLSIDQTADPNIVPLGPHSDGHRTNNKRFTSIIMDGFHWVRKQLPSPGAMNYAVENYALAESTPIGPGVAQRQFWRTVEAPLFIPSIYAPESGYGGVVQGQYLSQGLFDPYNNQYGNIVG